MKLILIATTILFLSCSTRQNLNSEYSLALKYDGGKSVNRTVVVFLVDGLSYSLLEKNIHSLPNLKKFYLGNTQIYKARSAFPSVTFPSISSFLTRSPVSSHQIYSNTLIHEEERIFFEKPEYYSKLNAMLEGKTIFSSFQRAGQRAVSLSYPFYADVSAHIGRNDSKSAISILDRNYKYVDHKLLDALKILLDKNAPKDWPEFIFVHLVGLDFTNHDAVSGSQASESYLRFIDQQLGPIFTALEKQKTRNIVSVFTSDHGHVKIDKVFDLDTALIRDRAAVRVLNEGRYATILFNSSMASEQRRNLASKYLQAPGVQTSVLVEGDQVEIRTKSQSMKFYTSENKPCRYDSYLLSLDKKTWYCPEALPVEWQNLFYPYFISNLAYYLQTQIKPELVLIPENNWSFHSKYKGQHGGPSSEEVFLPLLLRGASLSSPQQVPALWEILGFL